MLIMISLLNIFKNISVIFFIFSCTKNLVWNPSMNKCTCPSGWLTGPSNQCYYSSIYPAAWDNAKLDCISRNGRLLSINSQDELDFINMIRKTKPLWVIIFIYSRTFFVRYSLIRWSSFNVNVYRYQLLSHSL